MKTFTINFFLFLPLLFFAQDISGLWVAERISKQTNDFYGIMYLKVDTEGNVVGYTYDEEAGGWCNFKLKGNFNPKKRRLSVSNTDLIEKTENHKPSRYKLNYLTKDNQEFLEGKLVVKGNGGILGAMANVALSVGVAMMTKGRIIFAPNLGVIKPKRFVIYSRPKVDDLNDVESYNKLKPYIDLLESGEEPEDTIAVEEPEEPEEPEDPKEEEKPIEDEFPIEEVEATKGTIALNEEKKQRKNELIRTHILSSRNIRIELLDSNLEDGDRISVYINETLYQFNIEVKREPKVFNLTLPSTSKTNRVTFVANNLGRIPPNTATIRYTIDNKTYEEPLSTDKKKNKYLEFKVP